MNLKKVVLNQVKNRFLSVPSSASKGYEPEPKISDFQLIKELGFGSFGRVYLVYHKKTNVKYALKAIDKKDKSNIEEKPYFRREIEIMYRINHPNVVKLYGHFEDNNYCYFIMEYIPKGNIFSLIPRHGKKKQSNQLIASIIKDVASAVYFLHKMNPPIIHRDIKPENVLMDDDYKVKLTDFGWSNYLNDEEKRNTICGTPIYLAPEMINKKGHDEKVDIWCIGVLLFELTTGKIPFQGNNIDVLKYNIRNMRIAWPSDIDTEAKDLISKILKFDPNERLTIEEILKHPYIEKYFPNAINDLIIPDVNLKYKTFVVSVDNPKYWDPIIKDDLKYKKKIIEKGYVMNNFKSHKDLSINKNEKRYNNINNDSSHNNSYNNYNTTDESYNREKSDNYDKYIELYNKNEKYNKYDKYENKDSYNIYNKYDKSDKKKKENYSNFSNTEKYDILLKKYENLKKDYNLLKKNDDIEIDKLKKELKDKEIKINQLIREDKLYNFSERNYRRKMKEIKELEIIFEDLKTENFELKERIGHYSKYIKEKTNTYFDNLNEIRESIKGRNKEGFSKAMDKLKLNLDEETKKNFYAIIQAKDRQLDKYKVEDKMRREKEKQKLTILINKYDKTLSWQENENKDLKLRLKELERKIF